jgi:glycosyltransferase involved in cell wall biosynthesis
MDILHIVQGYTPAIGGTEWLVQRLSEELVRQFDDRVTVFTTDRYNAQGFVNPFTPRLPAGWEQINGVRVRRFRVINQLGPVLKLLQAASYRLGLPYNQYIRTIYSGPLIPGLGGEIRRHPADLIVAASFPLLHMYVALKAARQGNKPAVLIGCLHPEDRWGFQRAMIYDAIRQADGYLALTDYEARHLAAQGTAAERVKVVGGGVDPEPFLEFTSEEAKRRLGLGGQRVIGYIGQLVHHKGVDTLLRAMPVIWSKNPEVHLLVAGSRTSYDRQLQEIIDGWLPGYRQNLHFFYNFEQKDKGLLYSALDLFVYPSRYESFGIAFLEAWAAGKPVVGCRAGAIPSVVKSGEDGLLVEPQNAGQLAEAVLSLIQSPEAACRMGESGRQKVLSSFTWPVVARRYREAYQDTIDHYSR